MSKKIQSKIEELLFEVYEKGLQQETTDLTAYYKKIEQALNIPVVRLSLFDEVYDKFVECEDDNEFTQYLNENTNEA
jgi:hypothetical protein